MLPLLLCPWAPPPPPNPAMVSVSETPGSCCRMSRAIRSSSDCVDARLEPTGSRAVSWNRDSSSSGVKLTPDIRKSGYIEAMTSAHVPAMIHRCRSDHPRSEE